MSFQNKVVIITGAASGIGEATAIKFSSLSASLCLVDKNTEGLKNTLSKCQGDNHIIITADLIKREELLSIIPKTIDRFKKIDVLVNAAGIMTNESILDDDVIENYTKLTSVNLMAPIVLTNKAAPHLVKSKGNVVNICSVRSSRPAKDRFFYCTSKAGLEMFTKCIALELSEHGVRANTVHPGVVRSNLLHSVDPNVDLDSHYNKHNERLPFGVIEADEVARVVTFLASEDARSVTGSSYYIDGGFTLDKF